MTIYIGADYRGFERKNQLLKYLNSTENEVVDVGAYSYHEVTISMIRRLRSRVMCVKIMAVAVF